MSEGLGSFSADRAALHIAKRNCPPNELSLVFRKDGFSICFLILTSCFLGGVPATKYKNNFRLCSSTQQHQPRILDNAGSVSLVFNYSTPRCVFMTHVSSAMFWVGALIFYILFKFIFSFWFLCCSLHNCQRTYSQALPSLFSFVEVCSYWRQLFLCSPNHSQSARVKKGRRW